MIVIATCLITGNTKPWLCQVCYRDFIHFASDEKTALDSI